MLSAPAIYKEDLYNMVNTIISIPGYVHLYRSLLRFYDMPENEVKEMLYLLNTANLDCYEYYHPERTVIQSVLLLSTHGLKRWIAALTVLRCSYISRCCS